MVKPQAPQSIIDSWPAPNYKNPQMRPHGIFMGVTITFTLLTITIVGLRTYVRFFSLRSPGWDDYFIFIATLAAIAMCITVNLAMNYGWDRHYWDQRPEWFETSELMQWIIQITFIILMTSTKISALCTYLRASQGTKYRRFVWGTMVVVALWGIAFFFATIFECTPVQLYWTSHDGKGCANEDARLLIATIFNIVTDIQVILMPIPIIIKLHIPKREKITLVILMCLGGFATVASVVRTIVMSQSLNGLRYDMTWNSYIVWIWLILECDLAIICISVPVLRVFVRRYWPQWAGNNTHNKTLPTHGRINSIVENRPLPLKGGGSMSSLIQVLQESRVGAGIELKSTHRSQPVKTPKSPMPPPPIGTIIGYDRYGQPIHYDGTQDVSNLPKLI